MSRENIHSKIDELLELLSIHNGRLSLHAEKLSQLDIDVLRKQCIDLYDQVNLLALQGKIVAKPSVQKITPQESSSTPAPVEQMITEVVVSKNEITETAKEEDLNLALIPILAKRYKCEVGYSGHESTVSPSIGACYMGAKFIERHITLDRSMWGTDQSASLSPDGLRNLVNMIRKIQLIIGNGKKRILEEEKNKSKELRYW